MKTWKKKEYRSEERFDMFTGLQEQHLKCQREKQPATGAAEGRVWELLLLSTDMSQTGKQQRKAEQNIQELQ